jgi:hypothetical protein
MMELMLHHFCLLLLKKSCCTASILLLLLLLHHLFLEFKTLEHSGRVGLAWKLRPVFIIIFVIT